MFPEDNSRLDIQEVNVPSPTFKASPFPPLTADEEAHLSHPPRPSFNRFRRVLTFFVVVFLISTMLYSSLRPPRRIITTPALPPSLANTITSVSATISDCQDAPYVSDKDILPPTRELCICGRLEPLETENIQGYIVRIRSQDDITLGQSRLRPVSRPTFFCQQIHISTNIEDRTYYAELLRYGSADPLHRFSFRFQASRQA